MEIRNTSKRFQKIGVWTPISRTSIICRKIPIKWLLNFNKNMNLERRMRTLERTHNMLESNIDHSFKGKATKRDVDTTF
jgi:hypothetical protein